MTISTHLARIGAALAFAAALSACDSAPKVAAKPDLQSLLSQASQAAAGGNKEQAVTLWKQGAEAYPTEKSPWSHIAQTRYEAGQYGDAIQAALEVLVRDPNDKLANSIIAISGLRLSTRALGDLSRQNNLSGSIKTESQDLAKLLRDSLGERELFADKAAAQPKADKAPPAPKTASKKTRNGKASKEASSDTASTNPFKDLN